MVDRQWFCCCWTACGAVDVWRWLALLALAARKQVEVSSRRSCLSSVRERCRLCCRPTDLPATSFVLHTVTSNCSWRFRLQPSFVIPIEPVPAPSEGMRATSKQSKQHSCTTRHTIRANSIDFTNYQQLILSANASLSNSSSSSHVYIL